MQTKLQSLTETVVGTLIAFLVAMCVSWYVYPLFGFNPTHGQNFWLTFVFTVVSLVRSYCVRRVFNRLYHRDAPLQAPNTAQRHVPPRPLPAGYPRPAQVGACGVCHQCTATGQRVTRQFRQARDPWAKFHAHCPACGTLHSYPNQDKT